MKLRYLSMISILSPTVSIHFHTLGASDAMQMAHYKLTIIIITSKCCCDVVLSCVRRVIATCDCSTQHVITTHNHNTWSQTHNHNTWSQLINITLDYNTQHVITTLDHNTHHVITTLLQHTTCNHNTRSQHTACNHNTRSQHTTCNHNIITTHNM